MLEDGSLLKQVRDDRLLENAQASGAEWIGPVTAVFAELALHEGEAEKARAMLHAGLGALCEAEHAWSMLVLIASDGYASDIPRAQAMLRRASTGATAVGKAYLRLFESHCAARDRLRALSQVRAREAGALFARLHWPFLEAQAWELSGDVARAATLYRQIGSMRDSRRLAKTLMRRGRGRSGATLTVREREIADLAAAGLSNRAIAQKLAISQRTVGHHLESIFIRLNISSRIQLALRARSRE